MSVINAQNYTGGTSVTAGGLIVNGSIASSTVTVEAGAAWSGSGSVGGIVLNLGSTISPGNSPGAITSTGDVTWLAGANYNWQIHNAAATPGVGWDTINVTGILDLAALTVNSQFNINTVSANGTAGFSNLLNDGTFSVVQSGNNLNLVFTSAGGQPIPEPGTWAAAALLVGAAGYVRWRKRAKFPD